MIIITGASRGIGNYLLNEFTKDSNEKVYGLSSKSEPEMIPNNCEYYKVDVTNEKEVNQFVKTIESNLNNIKLLHCAGINDNAFIHKMEYSDWQRVLKTNLDSAFLLTKYLLPLMRSQGYGRIIYFSSVVQQIGVMGTASYSASKAGLKGLMRTVIKENSNKNITCNTLNLGYFDIGMIKEVPDEMLSSITKNIPLGRLGDPINILNSINCIFNSDYLTGSEININGGLY